MAGEPAFFELGVADVDRGRAFYGSLFGWSFESGPGGGWTIGTAKVPGGLHGDDPGASPYLFFDVDDLEDAVERVRALHGTVDETIDLDGDEASVARYGRFRLCRDDQGSPFGLHQRPPAS